jgi:hypothetical protein
MSEPETTSLPENAYRSLGPGESYRPIVPAEAKLPEIAQARKEWQNCGGDFRQKRRFRPSMDAGAWWI